MRKKSDSDRGYIKRILIGAVATCILAADPLGALAGETGTPHKKPSVAEPGIYSSIADEGLSATVCGGNMSIIKAACDKAHSDPDGKDYSDDTDGGVGKIFKLIDRQTTKILNLAPSVDTNPEDRARALYLLGLILRALDEFYLKSNYVELKIEAANGSSKAFDPYNVEPINWTKVGKDARSIEIAGFKFGDFDKSTAKTVEGAKKFDTATYFSIARELSVKESMREWNTLERLIRVKYPAKAAEIMVALKTASCPAGFKPESEE